MQGRSQHSPGVNATENWVVRLTTETAEGGTTNVRVRYKGSSFRHDRRHGRRA